MLNFFLVKRHNASVALTNELDHVSFPFLHISCIYQRYTPQYMGCLYQTALSLYGVPSQKSTLNTGYKMRHFSSQMSLQGCICMGLRIFSTWFLVKKIFFPHSLHRFSYDFLRFPICFPQYRCSFPHCYLWKTWKTSFFMNFSSVCKRFLKQKTG